MVKMMTWKMRLIKINKKIMEDFVEHNVEPSKSTEERQENNGRFH